MLQEQRPRRRGRRLAALLLGCLAGLAIAEAALRVAAGRAPEETEIVRRHPPPEGPQIRVWSAAGASGPRLLVVGDSYTFGHGVRQEDAFPHRLVQQLEPRGVTVVSYSRPGWNTRDELRALKKHLDAAVPDVLVLGYCLNDAEPYPTMRMMEQRPDLHPWQPKRPLETWLASRSHLFASVTRAVDTMRRRPLLRDYYRNLYRDSDNLTAWRRSLERIARLARQRRLPAVLVIFPIFDSDLDSDYAYRSLHATVAAIGEEVGFQVLDLLPTYAARPGREMALVPFSDPHPSAQAHAIAAREIARFLEDRGLVTTRGKPGRAAKRRTKRARAS